MEKKYLDYSGLKKFKDYLDGDIKKAIKKVVGRDKLTYATDADVDKAVAGEEVGDELVGIKTFAYYHKHVVESIPTPGSDLNTAVLSAVADALVLGDSDEKSEVYENVEAIVDEKMKWKSEFPE